MAQVVKQEMEAWDYFTHEQRQDEKHIGHYFEWFENVYPQIEQKKKEIVHNSQCESRDREIIVCPRCKDERVESDHRYYNENHCQACNTLNRQEEYRRRNNERLTEQFPNEFGIKKVWVKERFHYPEINGEMMKDENDRYIHSEISQQMYQTPCGTQTPVDQTTLKLFNESHKCIACKVLIGKSKATVMKQDEVADLFRHGIDGKHTGNKGDDYFKHYNYHSEDGILWHYSTIEGLRLKNGKIVSNTQCWSSGFAKCSLSGGDYRLPLTTIEEITRSQSELRDIEILDDKDDDTLIKLSDGRILLFGRDEYRPFLVQVPNNPTTIKEAYENLTPELVKKSKNVERQGDLFFIPMNGIRVKDVVKTQWVKSCKVPWDHIHESWAMKNKDDEQKFDKLHDKLRSIGKIMDGLNILDWRVDNPDKEINRPLYEQLGEQRKNMIIDAYKTLSIDKELVKPQIFKTNHEAQELGKFGEHTVVRGKIRHRNRQHSVLDLGNTWHIVLQNLGIQSWQVPNRGNGGGGD